MPYFSINRRKLTCIVENVATEHLFMVNGIEILTQTNEKEPMSLLIVTLNKLKTRLKSF